MSRAAIPSNENDATSAKGRAAGFFIVPGKDEAKMRQPTPEINPPPGSALVAANKNQPIRWNLEANGLTPGLVSALGELLSCAASYAPTKLDRKDLQGAAALAFDAANRMRSAAPVSA